MSLQDAEAIRPRCKTKHAWSQPKVLDLELVVRMAMESHDRTPAEHRALLRMAHDVDAELNAVTLINRITFDHHGQQIRPFSELEAAVAERDPRRPSSEIVGRSEPVQPVNECLSCAVLDCNRCMNEHDDEFGCCCGRLDSEDDK